MTATTSTRQAPASRRSTLRVTQGRVIRSEWIKLRSLRSTALTLLTAVVLLVGLGLLFSWGEESHLAEQSPAERLRFDPTLTSQRGMFLAQLAVGVLGVLVVTGEYGTGMIRASLTAVPKRLPVLWAKALVFTAVAFIVMLVAAAAAFFGGQAILATQHIGVPLSAPVSLVGCWAPPCTSRWSVCSESPSARSYATPPAPSPWSSASCSCCPYSEPCCPAAGVITSTATSPATPGKPSWR